MQIVYKRRPIVPMELPKRDATGHMLSPHEGNFRPGRLIIADFKARSEREAPSSRYRERR